MIADVGDHLSLGTPGLARGTRFVLVVKLLIDELLLTAETPMSQTKTNALSG